MYATSAYFIQWGPKSILVISLRTKNVIIPFKSLLLHVLNCFVFIHGYIKICCLTFWIYIFILFWEVFWKKNLYSLISTWCLIVLILVCSKVNLALIPRGYLVANLRCYYSHKCFYA